MRKINKQDCESIGCELIFVCGRNRKIGKDACFDGCCFFCQLECNHKEDIFADVDQFKLIIFKNKYAKE
jgi:hypothetical protein